MPRKLLRNACFGAYLCTHDITAVRERHTHTWPNVLRRIDITIMACRASHDRLAAIEVMIGRIDIVIIARPGQQPLPTPTAP